MRKTGIDIVENERIEKNVDDQAFLCRVLSENERRMMETMSRKRQIEFVAGRFACKEAIIKALSGREVPLMKDLDIFYDESGAPVIRYKDYPLLISLSHERHYSVAICILDEQ